MCLAQGPQRSDASKARTHCPSVSSQALYHWATALPSNIDKTKVLMTNGSLMKVESIAKCSFRSILQYFWPTLRVNRSWKTFLEWPFYTGFTVLHNVIAVDKLTAHRSIQPLQYATNSMVDYLKFQTLFSFFSQNKCWWSGQIKKIPKFRVTRPYLNLLVLFDLLLYVPSTIFQLNRDMSSWIGPVLS